MKNESTKIKKFMVQTKSAGGIVVSPAGKNYYRVLKEQLNNLARKTGRIFPVYFILIIFVL